MMYHVLFIPSIDGIEVTSSVLLYKHAVMNTFLQVSCKSSPMLDSWKDTSPFSLPSAHSPWNCRPTQEPCPSAEIRLLPQPLPVPPWGLDLALQTSAIAASSSLCQSGCSLSYMTSQCLGFLIYKMGIVVDMGNSNEHPLKKENIPEDDRFLNQDSGNRTVF